MAEDDDLDIWEDGHDYFQKAKSLALRVKELEISSETGQDYSKSADYVTIKATKLRTRFNERAASELEDFFNDDRFCHELYSVLQHFKIFCASGSRANTDWDQLWNSEDWRDKLLSLYPYGMFSILYEISALEGRVKSWKNYLLRKNGFTAEGLGHSQLVFVLPSVRTKYADIPLAMSLSFNNSMNGQVEIKFRRRICRYKMYIQIPIFGIHVSQIITFFNEAFQNKIPNPGTIISESRDELKMMRQTFLDSLDTAERDGGDLEAIKSVVLPSKKMSVEEADAILLQQYRRHGGAVYRHLRKRMYNQWPKWHAICCVTFKSGQGEFLGRYDAASWNCITYTQKLLSVARVASTEMVPSKFLDWVHEHLARLPFRVGEESTFPHKFISTISETIPETHLRLNWLERATTGYNLLEIIYCYNYLDFLGCNEQGENAIFKNFQHDLEQDMFKILLSKLNEYAEQSKRVLNCFKQKSARPRTESPKVKRGYCPFRFEATYYRIQRHYAAFGITKIKTPEIWTCDHVPQSPTQTTSPSSPYVISPVLSPSQKRANEEMGHRQTHHVDDIADTKHVTDTNTKCANNSA